MLKTVLVGAGKMGISHLSTLRAHPEVELIGVCDQPGFILDVLGKYTGLPVFTDYEKMLDSEAPQAVVIATPTPHHYSMAKAAIVRGISVFCEKPLTLSFTQSQELATLAAQHQVATQVGYHNRFVGSFQEVHRLVADGAIGKISHAMAESYGPVVLREKGKTWRSKRSAGGSCLYDYAAHTIDLLHWYLGTPQGVQGSTTSSIFSSDTDDEVYSNFQMAAQSTAHLSVNWSDESYRKMTTRITLWGQKGRIVADRQECKVYFNSAAQPPPGYQNGWNVRYTTELTQPVWFYLRGEEYSAEIAHFIAQSQLAAQGQPVDGLNDFASAGQVDHTIELILADAAGEDPRNLPSASRQPNAPAVPAKTLSVGRLLQPIRRLLTSVGEK
ncbi:Gfo/Idh/MocA family protein [Glutamicibacter ardleyensis]|uniref:Gfo/Idh/MocA family protein n=1 Tax=Glutamicibacter ardleyensis TaxID=225894 RepID=UPI003FD0F116